MEDNKIMIVELLTKTGMLRLKYCNCEEKETKYRIQIRNINEFLQIYRSSDNWYRLDILGGDSDDIYAPYTGKLKEAYDRIVSRRRVEYYSKNVDMNRKYKLAVPGQYKLIYRPGAGTVHLAYRKAKDVISRYCAFISDEVADSFKADCKSSGHTTKYLIPAREKELYSKWGSYVHNEYIKTYLRDIKGELN